MPVTIKDVATRAQVSVRTVSRVINNLDYVSPATRQKIIQVVDELGYRPNRLARALVTQRSRTIGLALPHLTNPFFAEVAESVFDTGREHGFSVLLNIMGLSENERKLWKNLVDYAVEGMIIDIYYGGEQDVLQQADPLRPVVVILKKVAGRGVSSVYANYFHGAHLAVETLSGKGHRKIVMLVPPVHRIDRVHRAVGYRQAMASYGLEPQYQYLEREDSYPDEQAGYEAALRLFQDRSDVSAVLAYNDLLAIGTIRACKQTGRRVPDDCAVIGFDDNAFAPLVYPSLTSIRVDKSEIGRQAVLRLLEMLDEPDRVFDPIPLDVQLVMRESA